MIKNVDMNMNNVECDVTPQNHAEFCSYKGWEKECF